METMIQRGAKYDDLQWRYSSRADALAGHDAVVAWLRAGGAEDDQPIPQR